jgi:hypothetical protein
MIKVREGSAAPVVFHLSEADGSGADLAGRRVEVILVDKDENAEETQKYSNVDAHSRVSVGARNQTQVLSSSGGEGTFTLSYGEEQTAALSLTATAAQVQAALAALSSIGVGNVKASGGPLGTKDVVVEFIGDLFGDPQPLLVSSSKTVTVTGQTVVVFTPKPDTFRAKLSPYKAYVRKIEPSGEVYTYPEEESGEFFFEIQVEPSFVFPWHGG